MPHFGLTLLFILSLLVVLRSATLATGAAARLATSLRMSPYMVGFLVVAVISVLPETFISISSALNGMPAFGLGLLFGSNVADLTLVFSLIIFTSRRPVKLQSRVLVSLRFFPVLLLVPIVLGLDGYYGRWEGVALILVGLLFYTMTIRHGRRPAARIPADRHLGRHLGWLLLSMAGLLLGAHFTVASATTLASALGVNQVLIGMLVVGLGTVLPELLFSLKSHRRRHDSLAVGDIFGTVLTDATIVVGTVAVISPFAFPPRITYITGLFMVAASLLLLRFMRTGRVLTRKEALLLTLFYIAFVLTELLVNG